MCITDYMQTTFFYLSRFLKKLADNQCCSTISNIIMSIRPFTMGVDGPEIGCWMEVSSMFDICTYCVFTLYGRYSLIVIF